MNLVKRAAARPYKIKYELLWSKLIAEAKEKWPEISNTEPTEYDLKSLAYKIALQRTDIAFNAVAEYLRVFQDSDIQVEFIELLPDLDNPKRAMYEITVKLAAEGPEPKPNRPLGEHDKLQTELNKTFIDEIATWEAHLKELGLSW